MNVRDRWKEIGDRGGWEREQNERETIEVERYHHPVDPVASCWFFLLVFSVLGVSESFFRGITFVQTTLWVSSGYRYSSHSLGRNVHKQSLRFPQWEFWYGCLNKDAPQILIRPAVITFQL